MGFFRNGFGLIISVGIAMLALASPEALTGQSPERSFELALYSPVQIRNEDDAIRILRFSLLYGSNESVKGLDVGLVSRNRGGVSKGLQYSLVGIVDGDFIGWQNNLVSITRAEFTGLQSGAYNELGAGEAFQFGLVNRARNVSGLQIGLVNVSDNMYGLQIGLANVIKSKEDLVFFPLVNWSF
ncbi:MAG: hypothetical protein OEO23_10975 [Gemmatimonadota bacterium]|nr:hypothetical protein [Gemmatimonadota bacterium]